MPNQRQSIHAFCVFCGGFRGGIGFVGVACKGVGTGFGGGNAGYAEPAGAAQSEGILTVFADIRQAGNRYGARAWLRLHKFPPFCRKTTEALSDKASEVFRGSSQIVVWIKCGFSSPVQLNIFTLYPWIRSAASHPSTLARSSTIPACAFASSYCFCS